MSVRLRRGQHEVELESIQAVREALIDGRARPDDEIWDPLVKAWRPLNGLVSDSSMAAAESSAVSPPPPSPGASRLAAWRREDAGPTAPSPPPNGNWQLSDEEEADLKDHADLPKKSRVLLFALVGGGAAVLAAAVILIVVFSGGTPVVATDGEAVVPVVPVEDLNRVALEEHAKQDAAKEEKGETYVKDIYRIRWKDNQTDPLAVYLYVRAVGPDDAIPLLRDCTQANPGFAWCWHLLSKHYADDKMWSEALEAAERAVSLFDATDIHKNHRWLTRVDGKWYEDWTGKRSASFTCKTPQGTFIFRVREKGRGTECPEVCLGPGGERTEDAPAGLCYDVSWMTVAGGWHLDPSVFGFRMDDGSKWAMTAWFDVEGNVIANGPTTAFGAGIAAICVQAGRTVVSAEYWNDRSCKGQYVLRDTSSRPPLTVSPTTQREFGAIRRLVAENTPEHMRVPDLFRHGNRQQQATLVQGYQEGWRTGKKQWQRRWMIFATGGGVAAASTELARAVRAAASWFSWEWDCYVHHSVRHRGGALRIYCSTEFPEQYDFSILTYSRHSGLAPGTHIRFGKVGLAIPDEDDDEVLMFGGTGTWDPRLRVKVVE